jgi:hypothetical protein
MKSPFRLLLVASLLFCFVVSCDKDDDEDDDTVARNGLALSGSQEVPVRTVPGSGTADVSYNKSTKLLTFTLNWQALTGIPTGSHIHGVAARGANAGVKYDFFTQLPSAISGTYSGSVVIDGTQIKEDSLLMGFYYFNIHTAANPGGEIRGQIEF